MKNFKIAETAGSDLIGETLYLCKRGCNFHPREHEQSDIGNYRVGTLCESVPGKDGRTYFLEFNLWENRKVYRTTHKRTGKPLKNPVAEIINPNGLHLSTEYTDENGMSWRNCNLEADISAKNYSYTKADILTVVNDISTTKYNNVKFVVSFDIVQPAGKNFTPSALISQWATMNRLSTENTLNGIRVKLHTGEYEYMAYHIQPMNNGNEKVTVILEEV